MKIRSISQSWERYRKRVLPKTASPIQISECQMAFYGGASAVLGVVLRLGDAEVPEDVGVAGLESLGEELTAFAELVADREGGKHGQNKQH